MLCHTNELLGLQLKTAEDTFGKVKDFYIDDAAWTVRYLVADTGDWLPGRRVLIAPAAVKTVDFMDDRVVVDMTRSALEASPSVDEHKPVSRQSEEALSDYFGWPRYWESLRRSPAEIADRQAEDPHLRSVVELTGYGIQATDGAIGDVEGFAIDLDDWTIESILVEARNWLPGGKSVHIPPSAVADIRPGRDETLHLTLNQDAIRTGPGYIQETADMKEFVGNRTDTYTREGDWKPS